MLLITRRVLQLGLCCFLIVLNNQDAIANVSLATIFQDHMVVQHNTRVPVWGLAQPGEKIIVTLGNQKRQTLAGKNGDWQVFLDKIAAGGPYTLTVAGTNSITINDVYAGEVWLCSGQSNMDMTVAREDRYWCGVINEKQEVEAAQYPLIRVFDVDFLPAAEPQSTTIGKWELISPQTVGHISAAAYFFARDLQQKMNTTA